MKSDHLTSAPDSTATRAASFSDDHASGAPAESGALSRHATLSDHDWDALRSDGFMAAYDGDLVLDCRTCVECKKSFSRTVPATTEAALGVLRAEGLVP